MVEKDLGFVLKRRNFRETSVIANLYTLRFGKITGIFKGFYTQKKEFTSSLEPFALNEFIFYPKKREIWLVSFADLICDYPLLRRDLNRAKVATTFFNLVDRTMQLWDKNDSVFYLLRKSLEFLKKEDELKILYIFLIKFLTISGFKPEFNLCIVCHRPLESDVLFSTSKGGLLCKDCQQRGGNFKKISKEAIFSLLYIQKSDISLAVRLKPSLGAQEEIFQTLRDFLAYHLDFDLLPKLPLRF